MVLTISRNILENFLSEDFFKLSELLKDEEISEIKDPKLIRILFDIVITHDLVTMSINYSAEILCKIFFMRNGNEITFSIFSEIYLGLQTKSNKYNLTPINYLIKNFPNFNYHIIENTSNFQKSSNNIMNNVKNNINNNVKNENVDSSESSKLDISEEEQIPEIIPLSPTPPISNIIPEKPKILKPHEIEKKIQESKVIKIKRKINYEHFEKNIKDPSPNEKAKITRYKKNSKKFREMDPRERENDIKYDYFLFNDKNITSDNSKELLANNPFMIQFFGDLDMDFRKVMFKIYKNTRGRIKDKTFLQEELKTLGEYFFKKLHITKIEDENAKKLSNAVCYIMKKLQNKIFESEDPAIVSSMLFFKSRLAAFYNFYRK